MRLLVLTSDDATRSHPSRDLCCIQFIPFSHPLFPATPLIKRKWINYSMKRSKSRLVCYTHSPEQLHHSLGPVHQAPRLHKPAQQPPKLLYHLPHLHTSRQITNQILSRKLLLLHCNCKKKKKKICGRKQKAAYSKHTFFGKASAFARPGLAVIGVDLALWTVGVTPCHISRLGEGLAGRVAGRGFAEAALGFGFEARLVERLLLRRPVAVHLCVIQRIFVTAVGTVRVCQFLVEREHPCSQKIRKDYVCYYTVIKLCKSVETSFVHCVAKRWHNSNSFGNK